MYLHLLRLWFIFSRALQDGVGPWDVTALLLGPKSPLSGFKPSGHVQVTETLI